MGADVERRMVSVCFVEEALDCLRRRGLATEPLLDAAGLPAVVDRPVSAECYGTLWLAIAGATGDEYFGLGARPMRPGSFTLLCHCILHTANLGQALRRALRFLSIVLEDPQGHLEVRDGLAQILLTDAGGPRSAFAYRTYWIILHGIACWLVGRRMLLRLVDFRCPEPIHSADYRLFFGAPVRFNQPVSRLAFDAAFLKLTPMRSERALRQFLRGAPANILVRYRYDAGQIAAVRARLRKLAPATWPGFEEMAQQMRLPASTLRHRLRQEGQTYAAIKDEIRRELAMDWLIHSTRSVGEIAGDLGFAEPSAFHRAFRKLSCGRTLNRRSWVTTTRVPAAPFSCCSPSRAKISSAPLRIQVAGGLIGQRAGRVLDGAARDRHPLLLAARELRRFVLEAVAQADLPEQVFGFGAALGRERHGDKRQEYIVDGRQVVDQVELLEDKADPVPSEDVLLDLVHARQVFAVDLDRSRTRSIKAPQQVKQPALPDPDGPTKNVQVAAGTSNDTPRRRASISSSPV